MRKSGVKFGLIGSASSLKKEGGKARPVGSKPPPRRRPLGATAVFDADSDEEKGSIEDPRGVSAVNKRLAAISAKQEKRAKKDFEDALQADPSVFDYDGVYDGMKESQESKVTAATVAREKEKRQPKYMGNLLKQAKVRALESDRIFERKLHKEREEQDKVEGEATMKFVTSAYKKKLMEQRKWELQQRLQDEREQRKDVTNKGMSGFYSNLITKNIAMGGNAEHTASDKSDVPPVGTNQQESTDLDGLKQNQGISEEGMDAAREPTDGVKVEDEGPLDAKPIAGSNVEGEEDTDGPTARMVDPRANVEKGDRNPRGDEAIATKAGRTSAVAESDMSSDADVGKARRRKEEAEEKGDVKKARLGPTAGAYAGDGEVREGLKVGEGGKGIEGGTEKAGKETVVAAAAKARKEAAIKAARERFLARKKAS